jgi:hypothetical protein
MEAPSLNPEPLLSSDQLTQLETLCISLCQKEFDRLGPLSQREVADFLIRHGVTTNLYSLFVGLTLHGGVGTPGLIQGVFGTRGVSEFILNLSDRLSIMLAVEDFELLALANTLAHGITRTKVTTAKSQSLIPPQTLSNLRVGFEDTVMLLIDNFWLITLVLLYLFEGYKRFLPPGETMKPMPEG